MTSDILVIGALVAMLLAPVRQLQYAAFAALLLGLTVYPRALISLTGDRYVGIATGAPSIYSFTVITAFLLISCLYMDWRALLRILWLWTPFILAVTWLSINEWPRDSLTISGLIHIGTGIGGFLIAYGSLRSNFVQIKHVYGAWSAILCFEAMFIFFDLIGRPLHSASGPQAVGLAGRVIGTASHPDQLAKIVFLAMLWILAYEPISERARRMQRTMLVTAVAEIALTQSRAALAAAVVAIFLYLVQQLSGRSRGQRALLIGGVLLVGVSSFSTILQRFELDPGGGDRGHLTTIALISVKDHFIAGVGLNHYVDAVGSIDALTASGVPVHNAFLLTIAEMGVVSGTLIWLPSLCIAVIAYMRRSEFGSRGDAARAFLAGVPGLVLLLWTGWGMLQAPVFQLLCVFSGGVLGSLRATSAISVDSDQRDVVTVVR
jgi:hypothetical protein